MRYSCAGFKAAACAKVLWEALFEAPSTRAPEMMADELIEEQKHLLIEATYVQPASQSRASRYSHAHVFVERVPPPPQQH